MELVIKLMLSYRRKVQKKQPLSINSCMMLFLGVILIYFIEALKCSLYLEKETGYLIYMPILKSKTKPTRIKQV